ncbi:MAG: hypothetical protein ACLP7J_02135 [Streptosporangiaceae bacterium]
MDDAELKRLAEFGVEALLPVERLCDVAEYCRDRCETTGDARYCTLGEAIGYIVEFFEERGAMEVGTIDNLDHAFKRHLGGVLDAETAESGALLGRSLREEILASLRDDRLA